MVWTLTIAGVPHSIRAGSLNLSATLNGRTTCAFTLISWDASYRPALGAQVIITEDGTRVFGGLIERVEEAGLGGGAGYAITTAVSAGDFAAYADRRYVNETIPAGSLAAALVRVQTYLASYGVTLDGAQVTGPTLPELEYHYRPLREVLDELSTLTAKDGEQFFWSIDHFKVLSMRQPSTLAAPFDLLSDLLPTVLGDLTVEPTRDAYANRVIVLVPTRTEDNHEETFTGDGSTTTFQLAWTPTVTRGYVQYDTIYYEPLNVTGDVDAGYWTYDPGTNTITRNIGAPALGAPISIIFNGTFSGLGIAEDAGEIAANGLVEKVVQVDTVPPGETAQSLAEGYLAQSLPTTKRIHYRTFEAGLVPGQIQTVTVPARDLSGDAVITDVVTVDDQNRLVRDVTADILSGTNLGRRSWRDVYRDWLGDKAGSGTTAATVGDGGVATAGPGAPDRAVQFNNGGRFGGDDAHLWYQDKNSLLAGGGGSSILATDFESCQVFGYDTHIADPEP